MQRRSFLITLFAIILPLIAAPLVLAFGPVAATAAEPTPDVVTDWTELCAWLEAHREDGGTVVLGADIEVDELDLQGDDLAQPVVIDTAEYGLTVLTSLRSGLYGAKPYGYLTITGEGVDTPVLSYTGAYSYSSYYLDLAFLTIRAYGRDGLGGTAFYVANDLDWSHMGDAPEIYASGAGAVGINCGGDAELTWLTVESDGVAIQAAGSLNLFACRIKGDLSADAVTLDTCDAPELPSATVLHRQISSIRAGWYLILGKPYAYQVAGRSVNEAWFSENRWEVYYQVIVSAAGEPDALTEVHVKYDRVPVDTEHIGALTVLPAHPLVPLTGLGLLPAGISFDLTVETVDGRLPHFLDNQAWGDYIFRYLYTGETLAPLTLWRSDDDGASWFKIWREAEPELTGAEVYCFDEILTVQIASFDYDAGEAINQAPFLLAFETSGLTGGQIVYFAPASGKVDPNLNGDRDGGDRMVLPWEVFNGGAPGDAGDPGNTGHSGGVRLTGGGSGGSDGGGAPQQAPAPAGKDNPEHTGTANQVENPAPANNSDFGPDPSLPANNPPDPSGAPDLAAVSTLQSLSDHKSAEVITAQVTAVPIIEPPETSETAASAPLDGQLSQAAQPADQSKDSANSFPVVPVVAGVVLVGGVGSVAYMYGKRRL